MVDVERLTDRQALALRALEFYLGDWLTLAEIVAFLRDNGYTRLEGRRPIIGWENTLRSLERRGIVEGRGFPTRFRVTTERRPDGNA